jgi:hypothetical protein
MQCWNRGDKVRTSGQCHRAVKTADNGGDFPLQPKGGQGADDAPLVAAAPLPTPVFDGQREDWEKRWGRQEREELLLELRTLRDDIVAERRLLDLERLKPTRY